MVVPRNSNRPKFSLGQVVATPGALEALRRSGETPEKFLSRHAAGDWGDVDAGDSKLNDEAIAAGERLLSAYTMANGERLWIITETDRSATTLLLPDEY
jgi:hypothetical protein